MPTPAIYQSSSQFIVTGDMTASFRMNRCLDLLQGVAGPAQTTVETAEYVEADRTTLITVDPAVVLSTLATVKYGSTFCDTILGETNVAPHPHLDKKSGGPIPAATITSNQTTILKAIASIITGDSGKFLRVAANELGITKFELRGGADQLLGTNHTGSELEQKTLVGTADQVTITVGTGTYTFSLPQNIHTAAVPTWAGLILTGLTGILIGNGSGALTAKSAASAFHYLRKNNANTDYEFGGIAEAHVGFANTGGHAHTGTDSTAVDHVNLANKGTNTHSTIDGHLAAAAPHSGHATLVTGKIPVGQIAAGTPVLGQIPAIDSGGGLTYVDPAAASIPSIVPVVESLLLTELSGTPANPAASHKKVYNKLGTLKQLTSGGVETDLGGAGGGGGAITDIQASRPAAATAGRIFLPTDGYGPPGAVQYDNGVSWDNYVNGFRCTNPPGSGSLTAVSVGSETTLVADGDGQLFTQMGTNSGTEMQAAYVTALPGGNYTFIVGMQLMSLMPPNYAWIGLVLTNGTSNPATITYKSWAMWSGNVTQVDIAKYSAMGTYNSSYAGQTLPAYHPFMQSVLFFKIHDNGTSRIFSVSVNCRSWTQIHSVGRTDYITPTHIGVVAGQAVTAVGTAVIRAQMKIFHLSLA